MTSELVQKFLGDSQQLQSFSIESATKPGDNFLSIIYRVKVKTTDGAEKSLILKIAIPVEDLEAFRAFPKEILAYKQYIPQFEKFWLEYAGEDLSFGPKCYYTAEEPLVIIVMDDLRPQGFEMRDRKKGLNGRESRMVLDKLAKFHACSVKYSEEVNDVLLSVLAKCLSIIHHSLSLSLFIRSVPLIPISMKVSLGVRCSLCWTCITVFSLSSLFGDWRTTSRTGLITRLNWWVIDDSPFPVPSVFIFNVIVLIAAKIARQPGESAAQIDSR